MRKNRKTKRKQKPSLPGRGRKWLRQIHSWLVILQSCFTKKAPIARQSPQNKSRTITLQGKSPKNQSHLPTKERTHLGGACSPPKLSTIKPHLNTQSEGGASPTTSAQGSTELLPKEGLSDGEKSFSQEKTPMMPPSIFFATTCAQPKQENICAPGEGKSE